MQLCNNKEKELTSRSLEKEMNDLDKEALERDRQYFTKDWKYRYELLNEWSDEFPKKVEVCSN